MPIEQAKLQSMLQAEVAMDKWWKGLSKKEQQAYIKAHPRSKYGKTKSSSDLKVYHKGASDYHDWKSGQHFKQYLKLGVSKGKRHGEAGFAHQKAGWAHDKAISAIGTPKFERLAARAKIKGEAARKLSDKLYRSSEE